VSPELQVTVTNDGATILSLLDIEHPAGKILVDLAQQQDKDCQMLEAAFELCGVYHFHTPMSSTIILSKPDGPKVDDIGVWK
jgi:hypothetical protein